MKIIFLGASDFSATVFEALNAVYPVAAVITVPDRPVGRKMELTPSKLKTAAIKCGVNVLEFDKVSKEGISAVKSLEPDIAVTAAFGQILSCEFLGIPKFGVLNVHASLLPKYRGASPIQAAVINGEKETGITIMKTVRDLDAGDILLQKRIPITDEDTSATLFEKLAVLGGEAIIEAIEKAENGKAVFNPQTGWDGTYCRIIKKADGKIDFCSDAAHIKNFVRAMLPWPVAYANLDGKMLKVFNVEIQNGDFDAECGEIIEANGKIGLLVKCKDAAVRFCDVQYEGSKRMDSETFARGHRIEKGTVLK